MKNNYKEGIMDMDTAEIAQVEANTELTKQHTELLKAQTRKMNAEAERIEKENK